MERKDINISKTEIIKPRLLVLCQLFYPELVSTGQTLTELCEELAVRGVDVEVICGPATVIDRKKKIPKHINYKGIKIKRVWGTRFPKLNLFGRIINQITYAFSVLFSLLRDKSRRPILVLTNPPFLAFICALLRRLGSKPYIYLVFDVYPETATRLGLVKEKALIVKLWNLLNRFTFKHADKVIAIGRCMQELLMEKFGNLNNKLEIVHVWSDDKLIQSSAQKPNPLKEKWGIKDKFVITYSGNMGRFHDMETIMEAVKALKDNEKILFLFIGEGFKKRWMEDFARKYKLTNCRFFPYVAREDLGFSLSAADIGLVSLLESQVGLSVPSKTYGFMAAGVPVIGILPSKSEVSRMIQEEGCGVVIKPGDIEGLVETIKNLVNNSQGLKSMRENGKKAIKNKYSLSLAANSYYDIICALNNTLKEVK